MSNILFSNFATTELAAPLASGGTSLTVLSGAGALYPSPGGGTYFVLVLASATIPNTNEIVKVTARSGDVMTIVRAQESTTALNWSAGDFVGNDLTAGSIAALQAGFPVASATIPVSTTLSIANSGVFYNIFGTSSIIITLPAASSAPGMSVGFAAGSAFILTITPSGGVFFGGATTFNTSINVAYEDFICVQSDGANWRIFSASADIFAGGVIALQSWVTSNFDPLGSAATALASAEAYTRSWADPAGSAATAQSNAETFATNAVAVETARAELAEALNSVTKGTFITPTTGTSAFVFIQRLTITVPSGGSTISALVTFFQSFTASDAWGTYFVLDGATGSPISTVYAGTPGINIPQALVTNGMYRFGLSAGTHTIDVYWLGGPNVALEFSFLNIFGAP